MKRIKKRLAVIMCVVLTISLLLPSVVVIGNQGTIYDMVQQHIMEELSHDVIVDFSALETSINSFDASEIQSQRINRIEPIYDGKGATFPEIGYCPAASK
jgi:predicted PurR-regulated permease PerM